MATYEELIAAARKADADGATDDARRLLEMAVALRGQAQPAPAPAPVEDIPRTEAGVPEGYFLNPTTGQMTSRDMLKANADPSRADAALSGAMQGTGFRFGDEVIGGLGYLEGGADMANFRREQARARIEANQEAYPWTYGLTEAGAGAAASMATLGGAGVAAAPNVAGRAAQGAVIGGTEGALYGAGSGEGAGRVTEAARQGGLGALVGGAAPVVINGVGQLYDKVAGTAASMRSAPSQIRASRAVQTAVDRSGRSVDEIDDLIRVARASGQPFTVADATGNSGQRMLAGIARSPGEARQEIVEFLLSRQDDQGRRIGSALSGALDATDTAAARTAALTASRDAAADAAYRAAREGAGAVNLTPTIDKIDDLLNRNPILGETALTRSEVGNRLMRLRGRMQQGGEQLIDFNEVLRLKQDLGGQIERARRAGEKVAPEMAQVYKSLDEVLEASSNGYRAANDGFRQASKVIEQVDAGKAAASPRVRSDDVVARFNALTPEQQAAFRAGYADPLLARVENAAPGVNKARPLMSDGSRAELGTMARDPEGLLSFLQRENDMFATTNRATGGSMTADNLADAAEMQAFDTAPLINLLTGNWKAATQQLGATAANAATGRNTATRQEIAKLLMSDDVRRAIAPALMRQAKQIKREGLLTALSRSSGRGLLSMF